MEQVEAAQEKARGAVLLTQLDDLVSAGRLTQAEADALKAAVANGTLDETLKAQARTRLEARLKEAVDSGRITQAQADEMLKQFDANDGDGPFGGRAASASASASGRPGLRRPRLAATTATASASAAGRERRQRPQDAPQDGGSTPGSAPSGGSDDSTA